MNGPGRAGSAVRNDDRHAVGHHHGQHQTGRVRDDGVAIGRGRGICPAALATSHHAHQVAVYLRHTPDLIRCSTD